MKYLAVEQAYRLQLNANTRELLALSKTMTRAESRAERAAFFAELAAAGRINIAPKAGDDPSKLYSVDENGTAHINIVGQLTPVAEQDVCGGYTANALTEYGYIIAATQAAGADQRVKAIDYHVNSPGGYVSGVDEAAQAMAAVPREKQTRAIVTDMAASAAYWLASQTDKIVAMGPGTRVGSIGVLAEDFNVDRALAAEGIDHRVFTSTDAPLKYADSATAEGQAQIVANLDQIHTVFRARVAEGRGVTAATVDEKFGKGDVLTAAAALEAGMIDEIQGANVGRRTTTSNEKPGVAVAAGSPAIKPKGKIMTLEQLKADHPEVFAQAVALGKADGIKAEQDRVRELSAWKDGHNADTVKVAEEAIAQGKTFAEVSSQLMSAAAKGPKGGDGKNPPAASTATLVTPAGGVAQVEGLSDDEVAALMRGNPTQGIKGMTIEEIRANTTARKEA